MCGDVKNPDFVLCGDDENSDPVKQLGNLFVLDDSFIDNINAANFNQLVHVPLGSTCSGDAAIEADLHADAATHPNSDKLTFPNQSGVVIVNHPCDTQYPKPKWSGDCKSPMRHSVPQTKVKW
jgi:hypothetical protein